MTRNGNILYRFTRVTLLAIHNLLYFVRLGYRTKKKKKETNVVIATIADIHIRTPRGLTHLKLNPRVIIMTQSYMYLYLYELGVCKRKLTIVQYIIYLPLSICAFRTEGLRNRGSFIYYTSAVGILVHGTYYKMCTFSTCTEEISEL